MMGLDTRALCEATGGELRAGLHRALGPVSIDTRTMASDATFFCVRGPRFDGHSFADRAVHGGAGVVVSDGLGWVDLPESVTNGDVAVVVVSDTIDAIGHLAKAIRGLFKGPVVGLTGSSGKTTTKDMIDVVLSSAGSTLATLGNLNNHLGVPLTLFRMEQEHTHAVIEMGMNASGEIAHLADVAQPSLGVVTTVGAAHLEGLGSIEAIARAKGELLRSLDADQLAIFPSDVSHLSVLTEGVSARRLTVGTQADDAIRLLDFEETELGARGTIVVDDVHHVLQLRLAGRYNLTNAMLALAVGRALGVSVADGVTALEGMAPPSLRGEVRTLGDGTRFILDCYNANPQSMEESLGAFIRRKPGSLVILGDMLELGPMADQLHRELGRTLATLDASLQLIAVGPLSRGLAESAVDAGLSQETTWWFEDAESAVDIVRTRLDAVDFVLLKGSRGMRLERIWDRLESRGEN